MSVHLKNCLGLLAGAVAASDQVDQYARTLSFNHDNQFTIATFSDLGFNESSEDYLQTQGLIETVLNQEKPDLVVLIGDVVDPDHANEYAYHFSSALELIKARQVPYVWTGGNKIPGYDSARLHEIDYDFGMSLSYTGYAWDLHSMSPDVKLYDQEKIGYFTSRIPIMDKKGKEEVFSVFTIDTTGEYCLDYDLPGESCASSDGVNWLYNQLAQYSTEAKKRDFIFMHKPVQEFMHMANLYDISGHKQQAIGCQAVNTGLFAAALEQKKVVWMNAGSDADNDFSGRYNDEMMFSYSRKSGYGGAGDLPRGSRIFKLSLDRNNQMSGSSYIIEGETGERSTEMKRQSPPNFGFSLQTQCGVDPFASMFNTVINPDFVEN